MPQKLTNQLGKIVLLSDEPFATAGGEGAIYDVIESETHTVDLLAKIYHTQEMADLRHAKIEFMFTHNPIENATEAIKDAIIWVEDLLYQNGKFVGFSMKKVQDAISLKSLTLLRDPSKTHGEKWMKFDHDVPGSHQKRLVIAYNLAQAIQAIHEEGNYVLVDMKPENIFVREDASISLVDLDGIQIHSVHDEQESFPAKVFTEEYAPAEKQKELVNHLNGNIGIEWDYFSLAVIIYELLFGIHPFQASHKLYNTRPELIEAGLFVHGPQKQQLYRIPAIHENFQQLTPDIQSLFHQTFNKGFVQPKERIKPQIWAESLLPQITDKQVALTVLNFSTAAPIAKKRSQVFFEEEIEENKQIPMSKTVLIDFAKIIMYMFLFIILYILVMKIIK